MRIGTPLVGGLVLGAVAGAAALSLVGRPAPAPSSLAPAPGEHVWCRRAEEAVRAGRDDEALRDAEQELRLAPDCARAHLLAGLLYERRSVAKPALAHLSVAAKAYPDDPRVQTAYGRVLALTGDYTAAAAILSGVTQKGDTRAEPFRWLGYAYMHLPRSPENLRLAEQSLRHALELEPGYAEANYDLALLLFRQGKAQQALPFAEMAIARRKHYPRGLYLLSRIQLALGHPADAAHVQRQFQHEDALVTRQQALLARLSRAPGDVGAALDLARTMRERGKPEVAVRYLRLAAVHAPDDPRLKAALLQMERIAERPPAPGSPPRTPPTVEIP
jgi:Tfp pilus assembly protein PilF